MPYLAVDTDLVVEGGMKSIGTLVRRFLWINLALAVPTYTYFMYQLKQAGMW